MPAWSGSNAFAAAAVASPPASTGLSTHVTMLLEAADHADKEGNITTAVAELKEAVQTVPQNPELHARLGIALLKSGDPLAAEREFAAAAALAATPGGLTPELSRLLQAADRADKQGNIGEALIELKEAVRTAPQNPAVHAGLGIAMLKAGDALTAERELRQARASGASDELVVPPLLRGDDQPR